jgi:glucose/arabinose dehydrogenase
LEARGLIRKILIVVTVSLITAIVSCNVLLPERFAINAPVGSMLFGSSNPAPSSDIIDERFQVPEGFGLSLFATGIDNLRWLHTTAAGDFVATRSRAGEVILVKRDADGDGQSDGTTVLLSDLKQPQGIEIADGWLYIAETDALGRVRFDETTGKISGSFDRIATGIPGGGNHWSRTIAFGPDGLLYMSVGSSCNVCEEKDPRRAGMLRFNPDGSGEERIATGLRNAVGFDWQPGTDDLYATDNGRDLLGDNFPPCELNKIEVGGFYGWPVANGDNIVDPDFGEGQEDRIARAKRPAHPFRAHNAPLGIAFVKNARVPDALRGSALVALHGSWNRTHKDGYKVVSLSWQPDGSITETDFFTGFLVNDEVVGRPVQIVEGIDGAFYISDDYSGSIWRVAYGESGSGNIQLGVATPGDPLAGINASDRSGLVAEGAALYETHRCATCHDATQAAPGVAVKTLATLDQRFDIAKLEALFNTPPPPMPIFSLSAEDKRALSVYLLDMTATPSH